MAWPMPYDFNVNFKTKNLKSRLSACVKRGESVSLLVLAVLLPEMFLVTLPVHATTYYVATNGNNSWTGTASNFISGTTGPWLNFAHVSHGGNPQLQPGDTLYVRGGIYDHSDDSLATMLFITSSGTSNSPIVITNYPGDTPIIYITGANKATIRLDHVSW